MFWGWRSDDTLACLSRNVVAQIIGISGLLAMANGHEAPNLARLMIFGAAGACAGILLVTCRESFQCDQGE